MSIIFTADVHLTDNPRDEYRWSLLPWIKQQVIEKGISQVVIGGDITDGKDRHSSTLVNRLIGQLHDLGNHCDVFLLKGNHDYSEANCPFFGFIEVFESNVCFFSQIKSYYFSLGHGSVNCLFLPSTKSWQDDWNNLDYNNYNLIFTHATFSGAISETGYKLDGIPPAIFKDYKGKVLSGDIHVPQRIGKNIEYVGSPYRIRFGDTFTPRLIIVQDELTYTDIHFPTISKHTVVCTNLADLEIQAEKQHVRSKDQVKVRVRLHRSEYPSWSKIKDEIKQFAQDHGWDLYGPELLPLPDKPTEVSSPITYKDNSEILASFIKAKKMSKEQADIGYSILQDL